MEEKKGGCGGWARAAARNFPIRVIPTCHTALLLFGGLETPKKRVNPTSSRVWGAKKKMKIPHVKPARTANTMNSSAWKLKTSSKRGRVSGTNHNLGKTDGEEMQTV